MDTLMGTLGMLACGAVLLILWTACRFGYAMFKLWLQGMKRPWRQVLLENLPF